MLDPEKLLGVLEFEVTGRSNVAGRATLSARATPLPPTGLSGVVMSLYPLGSGADHYELEVDSDCGVLLGVTAIYEGEHTDHQGTDDPIRRDDPPRRLHR